MSADRSLLDRLNALKPTIVSLDSGETNQSQSSASVLPIQTAEPPSREDALTARLRTLRNASASPQNAFSSPQQTPGPDATQPQITISGHITPQSARRSALPPSSNDADLDPLFEADESALDELLEGLSLEDAPPEQPPRWIYDPEEESKKIAALLEELQTPSKTKQPGSGDDGSDADRDDDSEGEEMDAEVKQVMSQALDEAELERSLSPQQEGESSKQSSGEEPQDETGSDPMDKADPLNLPTVPSKLLDPAPTTEDGFENDIAARMARLKGLGSGSGATDSFGLPSAPDFNPDDRPSPSPKPSYKRLGYTDEDQKTWCIVCLDDATIRCVGCDDDVYCARCWKEMHVGPSAGYDERGHQWVKFERNKR